MWEHIATSYGVLLQGIEEQSPLPLPNGDFFRVLELKPRQNEMVSSCRKKMGVVGSCLYRQGLMGAGILTANASVNIPLTEAVALAALVCPPLLIDH
jgi:hypothetical protein